MRSTWQVVIEALLTATLASGAARADIEISPHAYVEASPDGTHYVRVTPDERQLGLLVAYEVVPGGPDRELWRTQGWYSFEVRLADDGHHLVRITDPLRGAGPSAADVAVAFYEDGRLVRSYSTRDLVHDDSKVFQTASHYGIYALEPKFWSNPQRAAVTLTLLDGFEYVLDAKTGEILSTRNLVPEDVAAPASATSAGASDESPGATVAEDEAEQQSRKSLGLAFLAGAALASLLGWVLVRSRPASRT
jgi:hypothetical protein